MNAILRQWRHATLVFIETVICAGVVTAYCRRYVSDLKGGEQHGRRHQREACALTGH